MKTKLILFALVALSAFSQATVPIQVPGEGAVSMVLSAEAVSAVTNFIKAVTASPASPITLNGTINAAATTINVSSAAGLKTGQGCLIDSEISLITAINVNALTVTRAQVGTVAASHTTAAPITILRSGSYSVFIANVVGDTIVNSMSSTPGPGVVTQNTAHATAAAAIQALLNAGVTHVP